MTFVASFAALVQGLAGAFSKPSFQNLLVIFQGWVLARRHTITSMLVASHALGQEHKHHSAFHRLFAAARWSLDTLGLGVFDLIVPWCSTGTILLAGDDTLARKCGLKVFGVGMHHDPLLSSRRVALTSWGHSWVILSVIVELPFRNGFYFALPVLVRLYRSKRTHHREGGVYQTKPQLMVEMLGVLCHHRQDRRFHLIADAAYGGKSILCYLPANCELTSRLYLDARLFEAPPKRNKGQKGRSRKRGQRLPTPREMLKGRCRHVQLDLYGRRNTMRLADAIARAYHAPERELRVVAVDPLSGGRPVQAFFSTCAWAGAEEVLKWYAMRWSLECTIHDAKGHLGFEEPQGWTQKAVCRTAPMAMMLYSLIVVWFATHGHAHWVKPERPWYPGKVHPSFADMLATLREQSVREYFGVGDPASPLSKSLEFLIHTLRTAA